MAFQDRQDRKQRLNRSRPTRLGGRRIDDHLLVEICRAFVRNFDNILRLGLIVGGLWLIAQVDQGMSPSPGENPARVANAESQGADNTVEEPTDRQKLAREPFMNDNIRLHVNCTRIEFRKHHKRECEVFESEAYGPREHGQDDDGFLFERVDTLYAGAGNGG